MKSIYEKEEFNHPPHLLKASAVPGIPPSFVCGRSWPLSIPTLCIGDLLSHILNALPQERLEFCTVLQLFTKPFPH